MNPLMEITNRLNLTATLIPAPMIWLSTELNIVGVNQAFLDTLDASKSRNVIGMTLQQCFPDSVANDMIRQYRNVIESGQTQLCAEQITDPIDGKTRQFVSLRAPLHAPDKQLVGVIGISLELPHEKVAPSRQQAFTVLAQKMAHDIQSPLTAMLLMLKHCDELAEDKRAILNGALNSVKFMANNLLLNYRADTANAIRHEEKRPILCADFLTKLVRERQYQYQNLPVRFDLRIGAEARYALIVAQQSQLGRAVSNIISNAVDAVKKIKNACITLRLDADQNQVTLKIEDNGTGMPEYMVQKMMSRTSFTEGKQHGHGIGMTQVWDMVDFNGVEMTISSELGCGTTFCLAFARSQNASWLTDKFEGRHYDKSADQSKPDEVDQVIAPYHVERIKTAELMSCQGE